jgi:hypothetical protein
VADDTEGPAITRETPAADTGTPTTQVEAPETDGDVGEYWHPVGAAPKEPGWYPLRTNPNDQAYWDGEKWSGRRRWTAGHGWVETGDIPAEASGAVGTAQGQRLSANPYVQATPAESRVSGNRVLRRAPNVSSPLSLGLLLFMTSGVLLMAGSITTWIHASTSIGSGASVSSTTSGLAVSGLIGINGFVTFICGVVVTVLAGALMASDDSSLRLLAFVASLASAAFAIYVVVRIVQKVSENTLTHVTVTVGPGVFIVGIGGVLAALVAGARLGQRNH